MANESPENEVKSACLDRLDQWQKWGVVVDYDDVSRLHVSCHNGHWVNHNKEGKRDIIAIFKVMNKAWVYLIECKEPGGGNWSAEQQVYAKKFAWLNNVIYEVVSDASQVDKTLEEYSRRDEKVMQDIDVHMNLIKIEEETF